MLSYNGEIIKGVRRLSTLLLVLLLVISVFFLTSCGISNDSGSKDIETLEAIYEQSNWKFRQSSVNIQVFDKGTIKVSIRGEATERVPGGDEFAWIPVALLKNRPEYYALEEDKSPGADLTAYQIKDGLWSIVAFVPGTEKELGEEQNAVAVVSNSTNETNENLKVSSQQRTSKISIDVLIISPDFVTSLPLYLPIGQGLASVDTSVELLTKAKFIDTHVDPFVGEENDKSVDLTEFSPLLPDGKVKALTKLDPNVAMLWDLSNVQYRSSSQIFYQLWKWLSSSVIFIGIIELFYLFSERKRKEQEESRSDFERSREEFEKSRSDFKRYIYRGEFKKSRSDFDRYGRDFVRYRGDFERYRWDFVKYIFRQDFEIYRRDLDKYIFRQDLEIYRRDFKILKNIQLRVFKRFIWNLERFRRDFKQYGRDLDKFRWDLERFGRDLDGLEWDFGQYGRDLEKFGRDLDKFRWGFERFGQGFERFIDERDFNQKLKLYYLFSNILSYSFVSRLRIYGIITLLILTLFFPLVALSQGKNRTIEDPQRFCFEQLSSSTLCLEDFSLTIPSPNLKEDKIILELNLLPINVDKEKKVIIDFDDSSRNVIISNIEKIDENNNFDNTDIDSSKKIISITNFPDKFSRLLEEKIKGISNTDRSISEVIKSVNGDNASKEPAKQAFEDYKILISSIDAKPFEIKISLKNTRINQETRVVERIEIGSIFDWIINREIHLFPFDANSLDIPISLKDAQAVLSKFIFVEPENYRDAVVTFHDIAAETDLISGSRSSLKQKSPYPIVYSDKKFRIDVQLSRIDGFSRLIIFWIIPAALLVGTSIEIFSAIVDNNFVKAILTISLPVAISIFWGFVGWIHSNNSDVPYLFKSGLPTIIEPFALTGFIIFLLTFFTCLFAEKKYKIWIRLVIVFMFFVAFISPIKNLSLFNSIIEIIGLIIVAFSGFMFIHDIQYFCRNALSLASSSHRYIWQLSILVLLLGILLTISAAASEFSHLSSLEDIAISNDATLSVFFDFIKVTFKPFSDQIL